MALDEQHLIGEVHRRVADGESQRKIGKELGIAQSSVSKYGQMHQEGEAEVKSDVVYNGDKATYKGISDTQIRTDEELIKHSGMDPKVWRVKQWGCGAWSIVAKDEKIVKDDQNKNWKLKTPRTHQCFKVWADFERIMPAAYHDAVKELFAECKPWKPQRSVVRRPSDKVMCVCGLFDAHFGQRSCVSESGQHQTLESMEIVYETAFDDLRQRIAHITPELIVFPVGNDFVHVDNRKGETHGGTYVGMDGCHSDIIRTAFRSQERVIAKASMLAPVRLKIIPGNHGGTTEFYLGLYLEGVFRGNPRVTIDPSPKSRKYEGYGVTHLGFIHGHLIKPEKLPGTMMADQRNELHGTKYSEWFAGHNHRTMKYEDTLQGTTIHSLHALCASSTWEYDRFGTHRRAAEIYLYERGDGYMGHFLSTVKE